MPFIKSPEDLKRVREEMLQKHLLQNQAGGVQIIISMGTPAIAAGAHETMQAILEYIEKEKLSHVSVQQTGNLGFDSWEPIVQVIVSGKPPVTYRKVSSAIARQIMEEHIVGGKIVQDHAMHIERP
jgi:NADP-reducing hydrogenase subunit HndB